MTRFDINPDAVKNAANQESHIADELSRINRELRDIIDHIHLSREVEASIRQSLENVSQKSNSNTGKLRAYADTLKAIVDKYISAESTIVGATTPKDFSFTEAVKRVSEGIRKAGKALGMDVCAAYSDDPVNMANGNYVYEKSFFEFDTILPVSFKLFYNSLSSSSAPLGIGWSHNYDVYFSFKDDAYCLHMENDESLYFLLENEQFDPLPGTFGTLTIDGDDLVFTDNDFIIWRFDRNSQKLISVSNKNNLMIRLNYNTSGLLEELVSEEGVSLTYSYSDDGMLTSVSDHSNRVISISYDQGMLCSVKDLVGGELRFKYNEEALLIEILDQLGNVALKNSYDEKGRTTGQIFADGGSVEYSYDDGNKMVELKRQNQSSVYYYHDDLFRNIKTVYSDGEETFEYNNANLRTAYTDKNGNTTHYRYNERGALAELTNAIGIKTQFIYNSQYLLNRVVLDGIEVGHVEYNDDGLQSKFYNGNGEKQEFEYDNKGRISCITHEDNSKTTFSYDDRGNVVSIDDCENGLTKYEYDDLRRVIRTIDSLGRSTSYEYDDNDQIIKEVNPAGYSREYKYDLRGNVVEIKDYNGGKTQIIYNNMNRVSEVIDADGNSTKYEYDTSWNVTKVISANGGVTEYSYDLEGRRNCIKNPSGSCETATYDPNGNLVGRVAPDGGKWVIDYDALNRPVSVTDPVGAKRSAKYDSFGNVVEVLYDDGTKESWEYDTVGNLRSYTDQNGYVKKYDYTPLGRIAKVSDEKGILEKYEYFEGGRLYRQIGADGMAFTYEYDAVGNVTKVDSDIEGSWEFEYDCLNQLKHISHAGIDEFYEYDANGNVMTMTDSEGSRICYEYSLAGALLKVIEPNGTETDYEYDPCYRLLSILRHGSKDNDHDDREKDRVQKFTWDVAGNVKSIVNPDGTKTEYSYDNCGRVLSMLDPDGNLTKHIYRLDGTEEKTVFADGREVEYQYDALKRLIQVEDWLGITRIDRDANGQVIESVDHNNKTVKYSYSDRGQLTKLVYPDGTDCGYEYDLAGRLTNVRLSNGSLEYMYNDKGLLSERKGTNGCESTFDYDPYGRIQELKHSYRGELVDRYSYAYNSCGKKQSISYESKEGIDLFEYQYNNLGEISSVSKNKDFYKSYSYDAFGNCISMTGTDGKVEYEYDNMDRLLSRLRVNNNARQYYKYDKRGNLVNLKAEDGKVINLKFDALNRIASASVGDDHGSYVFNGLGRLVQTDFNINGVSRKKEFTYDINYRQDRLLNITDSSSSNILWDGGLLGELSSDGFTMFMNDERMSVGALIGPEGRCEQFDYDIFGSCDRRKEGFGFTGYYQDQLTGLYHAGAREYDPDTGRFISPDPFPGSKTRPITLNPFLYCAYDPINAYDPTGELFAHLAVGIVGAVAKVAVKAAGDVVNSVAKGKLEVSSWQSYVGAASGGFTEGVVLATTGNPTMAGAAGGAVENLVTGGLSMATGAKGYRAEDGYSWKNLVGDTLKGTAEGAASGFVFGNAAKVLKIPGITKGRGSFQAVWKQVVTKTARGQIKNISFKTMMKGIVAYGPVKMLDAILTKGKDKVKEKIKEKAKDVLKNLVDRYFADKDRSNALGCISGRPTHASCLNMGG